MDSIRRAYILTSRDDAFHRIGHDSSKRFFDHYYHYAFKIQPISDSCYLMDTVGPTQVQHLYEYLPADADASYEARLREPQPARYQPCHVQWKTMFFPPVWGSLEMHQGSPVDGGHLVTLGAMQMAGRWSMKSRGSLSCTAPGRRMVFYAGALTVLFFSISMVRTTKSHFQIENQQNS